MAALTLRLVAANGRLLLRDSDGTTSPVEHVPVESQRPEGVRPGVASGDDAMTVQAHPSCEFCGKPIRPAEDMIFMSVARIVMLTQRVVSAPPGQSALPCHTACAAEVDPNVPSPWDDEED